MDLLLKILLFVIPLCGEARIIATGRKARLSLAEPSPTYFYSNIDGIPGTYAFGYDIRDPYTGNVQFRHEERYPNATVAGSYGYTDNNGRSHSYRYIADERGYRVMRDVPVQPVSQSSYNNNNEVAPSTTWSRPKKKTNPGKNYITKLPIGNRRSNSVNNLLLPPSYYAED